MRSPFIKRYQSFSAELIQMSTLETMQRVIVIGPILAFQSFAKTKTGLRAWIEMVNRSQIHLFGTVSTLPAATCSKLFMMSKLISLSAMGSRRGGPPSESSARARDEREIEERRESAEPPRTYSNPPSQISNRSLTSRPASYYLFNFFLKIEAVSYQHVRDSW